MYNVMVVEDQAMPRQLFEAFISMSDRFNLVHSIKNADMADIYCEQSKIDLILMDVCTELNSNGLDAAERIKQKHPEIKIIIVTSMPEVSYLERAKTIGVDSFWYKEVSEEPILELMDRTMAGESIYPDSTPAVSFGNIKSTDLSKREIQVLREVIMGFTNAEIAERLNLSQHTVRDYIQVIMEKTGYRTRTELAVKARETGIIIPDKKN
ncbi:MAG: response regulator transcription factor [Clostridia bacterium]|nr:response regulator transcription factor [Clostridia bacterium]MBR2079200.1 response regulator transcription factor [Clostridia bacterium]MBR2417995.1 response regulator transcription factor [Clostridia bacterium]